MPDRTAALDDPLPGSWKIAQADVRAEPSHTLPDARESDPFDFRPLRAPSLELPEAGQTPEMARDMATHAEPTAEARASHQQCCPASMRR